MSDFWSHAISIFDSCEVKVGYVKKDQSTIFQKTRKPRSDNMFSGVFCSLWFSTSLLLTWQVCMYYIIINKSIAYLKNVSRNVFRNAATSVCIRLMLNDNSILKLKARSVSFGFKGWFLSLISRSNPCLFPSSFFPFHLSTCCK